MSEIHLARVGRSRAGNMGLSWQSTVHIVAVEHYYGPHGNDHAFVRPLCGAKKGRADFDNSVHAAGSLCGNCKRQTGWKEIVRAILTCDTVGKVTG